jgi:hypothetical protein
MNKELENSEQIIYQVVGKETGFSVPQNYFETIEDQYSARLYEVKSTMKGEFEIPENYFNNLEDMILQKIVVEKGLAPVISIQQRILKLIPLSAAAAVVLFIGVNSFNFGDQAPPSFDAITDIEMENWLDNNSNSLSSDDIVMVFSEGDLTEIDFAFTEIEDINIERYISNSDDLTILNELY